MIKLIYIFILSLTLSSQTHGQNHLLLGNPSKTQLLARSAYLVSYDTFRRIPEWVAYTIKPDYLINPRRKGRFKKYITDPDLTNPVVEGDYTHSGFARGHLAPWAISGGDRDGDGLYAKNDFSDLSADKDEEITIFEINYMSNMAPQNQRCFNGSGGVWYKLESFLQNKIVAGQERTLSIFAGTVFYEDREIGYIGPKSDIAIPHAFYKLVVERHSNEEITALPFLFPHYQENPERTECALPKREFYSDEHLVSVDELESLTGLDFLRDLEDLQEQRIEALNGKKTWNELYRSSL